MSNVSREQREDAQSMVIDISDETDLVMSEFIHMVLGDFPDATDIRDLSDDELDQVLVAMGNMSMIIEG